MLINFVDSTNDANHYTKPPLNKGVAVSFTPGDTSAAVGDVAVYVTELRRDVRRRLPGHLLGHWSVIISLRTVVSAGAAPGQATERRHTSR